MRWRWREPVAVTSPDEAERSLAEAERSNTEALTQLEESFCLRGKAEEQRKMGKAVAEALATIRAENHFQELWNEGLRGGR